MRRLSGLIVSSAVTLRFSGASRKTIAITNVVLACLLAVLGVISGCTVGRSHTPDLVLEKNFFKNQSGFFGLLTAIQSEPKLTMIGTDSASYADHLVSGDISELERIGLRRSKWISFQNQLRSLQIVRVTKAENAIEFRVDEESMSNGSSTKGYWYQTTPVTYQITSLDDFANSSAGKDDHGGHIVLKSLKKDWYLYIYVNGH